MATKKKNSAHPSGVDRWTSNGLGIRPLGEMSEEHKARVAEVNRELARAKGNKPTKKK